QFWRHRRGWRQGHDAGLLQRDVALACGDVEEGTAFTCGAAYGLLLEAAVRDLDVREFAFDVSVIGIELVSEIGLFGYGDADGAVAIFDGDVAQGRRAGHVDRAVAI